MKIYGIQCPSCKDIIFSRARHDFRFCSCGETAIDGGFDYTKVSFNEKYSVPKSIELEMSVTREQLYQDWNKKTDKYGVLPGTLDEE